VATTARISVLLEAKGGKCGKSVVPATQTQTVVVENFRKEKVTLFRGNLIILGGFGIRDVVPSMPQRFFVPS
jgi:hypothetical protein